MDFWGVHSCFGGFFLCVCCVIFPRFTLAALAIIAGHIGITFWGFIGWIFAPRLTIAIIATTLYWHTNAFLCVLSWFFAIGGETAEKNTCVKMAR